MVTPKIPKRPVSGTSSTDGDGPAAGEMFPLTIGFSRDPREHVAMMFDITGSILSSGRKNKRKWVHRIILFAVSVLATLAVFQLLERYGPSGVSIPAAAFGFAAGALFAGLIGLIYQGGYKKRFRERIRDNVMVHVTFDDGGVRSLTDQVDLTSPWHQINDIIVKNDLLILIDEVWAHYVPTRALPSGITMQTLQTECNRRHEAARGKPS